jgi:hypothetical protein
MFEGRRGHVLGLTGAMSAGKDSVADVLVKEFGYVHLKFADPLWEMLLAINPLIPLIHEQLPEDLIPRDVQCIRLQNLVNLHGREVAKREFPEVRRLLQKTGTEGVRTTLGEQSWVDIVGKKTWHEVSQGNNVVVSDVRFENEARFVLNYGGKMVKIIRPSAVVTHSHSSEKLADVYEPNVTIHNTGSLMDLAVTTRTIHAELTELIDTERERQRISYLEAEREYARNDPDHYCYYEFGGADCIGCGEPYDVDLDMDVCPECGKRTTWSFDREICAEPCNSMHYYSQCCGAVEGTCENAYPEEVTDNV